MKKVFYLFFAGFIIMMIFSGCRTQEGVIAYIGKEKIYLSDLKAWFDPGKYDFYTKLTPEYKAKVLENAYKLTKAHKLIYMLAKESKVPAEKNEQYTLFVKNFEQERKPFLLNFGIPEKDIDRMLWEYWVQKEYVEKIIKPQITYTEDDIKAYYEQVKHIYFTVKPFIKANKIAVKLAGAEPADIKTFIGSAVKKNKNDYEKVKAALVDKYGENAYEITDQMFSQDFLKEIFEKSLPELENIFKTDKNRFTESYERNDEVFTFFILDKQTEKRTTPYEEAKNLAVENYINTNIGVIVEEKQNEFMKKHKERIIVEDLVAVFQ